MCECILGKTAYQYQLRILELEEQLAGAYRDARVALSDAYERIAVLEIENGPRKGIKSNA